MEIESALFDKMKKEAKIRSHCHWFLSEKLDCGNKYFTNDYIYLKNSLIIQEQNTKKNHKRVVVLYVIKNHVNLHKL
jgi:hypothetical protein